ncbi:MAG: DEAD/DEAH box helicase [Eubacterium sp.]|nr:DEAD/DEAH box helicase [Eubacterium sp.]
MNRPNAEILNKMRRELNQADDGLERIVAIKEKKEQEILTAAKPYRESVSDLLTKEGDMKATVLLRSISQYLSQQEFYQRVDQYYHHYHQEIEDLLEATKVAESGFSWIFASGSAKESACQAFDQMSALYKSDYLEEAGKLLSQGQRGRILGGQVSPWEDFQANPASYFALLERLWDGEDKLGATSQVMDARKKITGDLSDQLLEEIDGLELNLSLLHVNLRNYQTFGSKYILHQKKVLLGDEMGLGKTMQAIAAFCHLAAEGKKHFLVVCPLSVVVNWTREVESNSDLKTIEIYSQGRDQEMAQWVAEGGVGITTFETLNKVPLPEGALADMLVVDEAHYIKNPKAQRTMSVMAAAQKSERILLMSGTPMENKVEEMNFLISLLQPDIAKQVANMTSLDKAKNYQKIIAPVYLRRVREDVLKELPELIEKEEWGIMNSEELASYRDALSEDNFMAARQLSWNLSDMSKSTKAERMMEIVEEMVDQGRKIIVFSYFKNTMARVASLLGPRCAGIIDGSVAAGDRQGIIDAFGQNPDTPVLVAQIQAAGVGLNIQAASVILFCEPQLKPSIETQAVARAYRMGQTRSVLVHRLLMKDSVDERIMSILYEKTKLFEGFADESIMGDKNLEALGDAAGDQTPSQSREETMSEEKISATIMEEEKARLGI